MSFTAVALAGVSARVYLSADVVQSRLSARFVQAHIPRKSRCSEVEIAVSACLQLTSFTCIIKFVVDPCLNCCDAILGLDWSQQCQIAGMLPLTMSLARLDGFGA